MRKKKSQPSTIQLLKRIPFPIIRWDIWPFILILYPILLWLTCTTWDQWHPTTAEVLGKLNLFDVVGGERTETPYVRWIFDAIDQLPVGVPGLYPSEDLPVALAEPLLQSSNFALLLFAAWGLTVTLNAVAFLMPHWNIRYKAKCLYQRVTELDQATHLLILSPSKKSAFCALQDGYRFGTDNKLIRAKTITYLKKKFSVMYADDVQNDPKLVKRLDKYQSEGCRSIALVPPQYDLGCTMEFYKSKLDGPGIGSRTAFEERTTVFGKNEQDIPIPSFLELFGEHARAPLFVFQVFCQILWLIDEYWQFSMMSLGFLAVFEGQIVHRRRKDLSMIKGMHMPPIPVAVKRLNKWWATSSVDLVPGDIFSLAMSNDLKSLPVYPNSSSVSKARFTGEEQSISVPCDALLLQGSAVVNEAMLTGESLPQMKAAIDFTETKDTLDLTGKHKNSALFAGTSVILESSGLPQGDKDDIGGAIFYCLKTGFQTTQGKLIRTVLYSSERATVASTEAIYFLLILLVVAIFASVYVLAVSWGLPNRNHFKLLLHCIMIITAVVPPELPVTMSMTVTLALAGLFKKKLYCTEPFRIPLAGKLTVCCFDKTGTLTASEVVLEAVSGLPTDSSKDMLAMSPTDLDNSKLFDLASQSTPETLPEATRIVMGYCHSLVAIRKKRQLPLAMRSGQNVAIETQILGDPLEKAALIASGCEPVLGDTNSIKTPKGDTASILRRFAFASENQRMTVVVREGNKTYVVCKGAAERIATLIDHVPVWYRDLVSDLALQGRRVLALAAREFKGSDLEARKAARSDLEMGLKFCGLLVFGCPIKDKTNVTLDILRTCGHRLVMITGDDPRTAAHVALETSLCPSRKQVWFLETSKRVKDGEFSVAVRSRDGKLSNTLSVTVEVDEFNKLVDKPSIANDWFHDNALVVTGKCLSELDDLLLVWIVSRTSIFARVTPKDKELILEVLNNRCGETTLMCGDGTNDVGALKVANVGISLLNFDIDKIKKNKKNQIEKIQKAVNERVMETPAESRKRRLDLGLTSRQIAQLEKMENALEVQARGLALLSDNLRNKFLKTLRTNIANAEERFAQDNLARAAGHHPTQPSMAQQMQTQLEDEMPMLKPGDASMASPFTYRGQNIKCVKLLVRSGKGTLATVMMMYKLMALNSLTTAFALSVLTLNGVKMGDGQSTAESLFISVLFMAASNARCAKQVTRDRVIDSLFDKYFFMSIILQALVHIATASTAWFMASFFMPAYQEMDGPFKPNLVNTVIYLVSAAQHVASFTANYEGAPFLISMQENKVLNRGLMIFIGILFCITGEVFPFLNAALKLVPFPTLAFRYAMVALVGLDISLATLIGITCTRWGRQRITASLRE